MIAVLCAHADRSFAARLQGALNTLGLRSVRIDADGGAALERADLAIVVWSAAAVADAVLIDRASNMMARDALLAVHCDDATAPPVFASLDTFDLVAWDGASFNAELQALVRAIEERTGLTARLEPFWRVWVERAEAFGASVRAHAAAAWLRVREGVRAARQRLADALARREEDLVVAAPEPAPAPRRPLQRRPVSATLPRPQPAPEPQNETNEWVVTARAGQSGAFVWRSAPDYAPRAKAAAAPEVESGAAEEREAQRSGGAPRVGAIALVAAGAVALVALNVSRREAPPVAEAPVIAPAAPQTRADEGVVRAAPIAPAPRPVEEARAAPPRAAPAPEVLREATASAAAPEPALTVAASSAPSMNTLQSASVGPAPRIAPALNAYDVSALSYEVRAAAERARRAATRANSAAELARAGNARHAVSHVGGASYAGEWANGAANGVGRADAARGEIYLGAWRGSRREGPGVLYYADGRRFEGEFADGRPTYRGVLWDAQGRPGGATALFRALLTARAD